MLLLQHFGLKGGPVAIVWKNIPPSKNQVIQTCQWNEISDARYAIFEPLTQANRPHLRQRTNGKSDLPTNGFHTGQKSCAHRPANSGNEHTELPLWFFNLFSTSYGVFHGYLHLLSLKSHLKNASPAMEGLRSTSRDLAI